MKNNIKDFKNLQHSFDFSNLDENHELLSTMHKKAFGKFKIESPRSLWIDKLCLLRAKSFSFVFSIDKENRTKLKGIEKDFGYRIEFKDFYSWLLEKR